MTHSTSRGKAAFSSFLLLFLTLCIGVSTSHATPLEEPNLKAVERSIQAGRWPNALKQLDKLEVQHPNNGAIFFLQSYCHHNLGDLRKAIEMGTKAAAFPKYKAGALYNLACAHSQLNEIEESDASLKGALAAGYMDFDNMEKDTDLANLRGAKRLPLPSLHVYQELKGRNGVIIPYRVLLPEDFNAEQKYSVAVSFAPGTGGPRATDWTIDRLWSEQSTRSDWIIVCAVAPKKGWLNHPSHHALEDLFKKLNKDYNVNGDKFHLVGFATGARPASTYASMSKKYTASLTIASANSFTDWNERDFKRHRDMPTHVLIGELTEDLVNTARQTQKALSELNKNAKLTVLPGDGFTLQSLTPGKLLDHLASEE